MFTFEGYRQEEFLFEDHPAVIVFPSLPRPDRAAVFKMEYWGAFPAAELLMLQKGFHLIFIQNDNRWGDTPDLERKARFFRYVQEKYTLAPHCVAYGQSCGGLFAIKFSARYPELVSCIYADAPVLNYMSCPCGFGIAKQRPENPVADEILKALNLTMSELISYRDMPMDHLHELIENRIPVILVVGDSDGTVPYIENGYLLEKAYKEADVPLEVYLKPGCDHHPHGLEDPTPIADFIDRWA